MEQTSTASEINLISNNTSGNQWHKNGELIADANDYILSVALHSTEDTYSVITNVDGCESEMSDPFTVTSLTEDLDDYLLYPNPANNSLSIPLQDLPNKSNVRVYNSDGQLYNIPWVYDNHILEIDITILPSGGYFLKINQDNGNTSLKFLKK